MAHASQNPELLEGFQQSIFKGQVKEGSDCKLLCVVSFFLAAVHRSGQDVPVNLQQNKCYSLFYNFLSLYEWKSVIPLRSEP